MGIGAGGHDLGSVVFEFYSRQPRDSGLQSPGRIIFVFLIINRAFLSGITGGFKCEII